MENTLTTLLALYKAGFRQQSDATCGPASIILAGMQLGLERREESEWMSERFAAYLRIEQFPIRGLGLHELQFISEVIFSRRIDLIGRRAYPENYSAFLHHIEESFKRGTSVIIVNYLQDDFIKDEPHPSGNPHYSVIAGWNAATKQVLIADVDPFVTAPYWVDIKSLFESMSQMNTSFQLPRGWLVLSKRKRE